MATNRPRRDKEDRATTAKAVKMRNVGKPASVDREGRELTHFPCLLPIVHHASTCLKIDGANRRDCQPATWFQQTLNLPHRRSDKYLNVRL
jgi:hypothetical protein